jgi:hypothetical protein
MIQVYWYMLFGVGLLVHVYSSIYQSDSVKMFPSYYLYVGVVGRGKDRWFYPPSGCS